MKKQLLVACLALSAFNTFAGTNSSVGDNLPLSYIAPEIDPNGHFGRAPICPPSISIDGHTLYFWDTCDFTIYIKEENENGSEHTVYSTFVAADDTAVSLPSYLCGMYLIEVVRGEQRFVGEISL